MTESTIPSALVDRMAVLGLDEDDLEESFVLGSGAGGQKINKTHNCVRLLHRPSGQEVRCQESRSRDQNRWRAREILCERLEQATATAKLERARIRALKRVQHRRLSPGEKRRRAENKRHLSAKKSFRKRPGID